METEDEVLHSPIGGSIAAAIIGCPGRLKATLAAPKEPTGEAAREGIVAHKLAALGAANSHEVLPDLFDNFPDPAERALITEEMVDHVQEYIDYCWDEARGHLVYEQTVYFGRYAPAALKGRAVGSADAIAYDSSTRTLNVIDLKYGTGKKIRAKENMQLALYALGAHSYLLDDEWGVLSEETRAAGCDRIRLHIYQPRIAPGTPDIWETSFNELDKLGKRFKRALNAALKPQPKFKPGLDNCRYCPGRHQCPALNDYMAITYGADDFPPESDREKIAAMIADRKLWETWLDDQQRRLVENFDSDPIPGFYVKRIPGRTAWSEDAQSIVRKELGDEGFAQKILSPSALRGKLSPEAWENATKKTAESRTIKRSDG